MKLLFWILLVSSFAMGIYACLPGDKSELLSVYEIQTELVRRGHNIKIDGKFGKNTDHALELEITKQGEKHEKYGIRPEGKILEDRERY